jgi:hypothetical protein
VSAAWVRLARGARHPTARAVVATVGVVTLTVVALWWSRSEPPAPSGSTDAVRVGVASGGSIEDYVRDSRRRLAAHGGAAAYALASFDAYLPPERLTDLLAGVEVAEVIVRVPVPDAQTEIVRLPVQRLPADLYAGLDRVAERKEAEARRDADPEGARISAAEAAVMRARGACVYAAVVRALPDGLAVLATRPGLRTVDPAPGVRDLAHAVFLPPLPEQSDFARPPPGR